MTTPALAREAQRVTRTVANFILTVTELTGILVLREGDERVKINGSFLLGLGIYD